MGDKVFRRIYTPASDNNNYSTISIAFMNIKGQTGLDISKQKQIEDFIKAYKVDILNLEEVNIVEDSFTQCSTITSSFQILSNNASNKYGNCSLVKMILT